MAADTTDFADGQTAPPAAKVAAPAAVDLSAEIAATIEREPGDRVRCTWISGSSYRCNWWAPSNTSAYDNPGMFGLTVTTHLVRKSQFLTVTKSGERLVIRDRSRGRA
jgi:hypothetical protein